MTDRLDRILASEAPITPSVGFVSRVMSAIRQSQAFLLPIGFPWRRFMVGLGGACLCMLVSTAVLLSMNSHSLGLLAPEIWAAVSVWAGISDILIISIPLVGCLLVARVAAELMSP